MVELLTKMVDFIWENIVDQASSSFIGDVMYYMIIFSVILVGYLLIKPVTNWLVSLKSIRLLSYLMNSLLTLIVLLLVIFSLDQLNGLHIHLFKIILQCLASFGVTLILYKLFLGKEKKPRNH